MRFIASFMEVCLTGPAASRHFNFSLFFLEIGFNHNHVMDLFYQSMYIIRANCMEGFCEADLYITSDKFDHNEFFHLDMEPFPLKSAYELK